MTTSILSPCPGNLSGYDIQVLRDFALEAPWEWRKAFEALIATAVEAQEKEEKFGEAQGNLTLVKEATTEAVLEIRTELKAFRALFAGNRKPSALEASKFEEEVLKTLDELEKVVKQ